MWLTKLRDKIFGIDKLKFLVEESIHQRVNELKAIEVLKPFLPKGYLFETEYSMSFQTIQHIANDITFYRPKSILEIGSGLSTIILNNLIKTLQYEVDFYSVDQDSEWQNVLKSECELVDFHAFNISSNNPFSKDGRGKWYDIPSESSLRNKTFDLVIIDGPKGTKGELIRYGIVNFLKGRLKPNSIVFLDDTNRNDEIFILKKMVEMLNFKENSKYFRYSRLSNNSKISTTPS